MNPVRSLAIVLAVPLLSLAADAPFPFVMPWDDASATITDLSSWNEKPAGKHGFIVAKDGHLFAGKERLRIFGVNFCFGANFPDKEAAPKIAARLAKLGVNCVRFHHMDSQSAPRGIFGTDGRSLDPAMLDRLDFFISQLKANGIYADLNLHVSRTYPDRPSAEKEGNPHYDKGVDNFSAPMIALQKEYARALLGHVNPYTGNTYAKEPAIALVEINNENALFREWHTGGLDHIAAPYRGELSERWSRFLTSRHGSDEKIAKIFTEGAKPAGPELLTNGDFARKGERWQVEQHEGTNCVATYSPAGVQLTVSGAAKEPWHAQVSQAGLNVSENQSYTVAFEAKASGREEIHVTLSQAHAPWQVLDSRTVTLGPEMAPYRVQLRATDADANARISFNSLARTKPTTFHFAAVSLHAAAVEGAIARDATGQFPAFTRDDYAQRTRVAQEEWLRFLWSTEENYWPAMQRFLREELGVRSLIVGTQLGWSPFPIQQSMDVIDSHAYWQHPRFPGKPWDPENWLVQNVAMTGAPTGGTLPALALQRVAGKPYICTEYNHPAPNGYRAETFPLICAYAALQDWDGVFAFAYSHRTDDWDKRYASSFFDIDQDPARLAPLPGALALFRRHDVRPAKTARIASVGSNEAILQVGRTGPRLGAELFGVKWPEALIHRVGVRLSEADSYSAAPEPEDPRYVSDTSELAWDTAARSVTVNTPRSKAVLGEGKGKATQLGDVTITVDSEWACIQATVLKGDSFANARQILITATASSENTGMKWRDHSKSTVGRDWGKAPSLMEGVRGTIALPTGKPWRAWSLDERGTRLREIPLSNNTLPLSPAHRTVWYEALAE